jgi:hypothetical protein
VCSASLFISRMLASLVCDIAQFQWFARCPSFPATKRSVAYQTLFKHIKLFTIVLWRMESHALFTTVSKGAMADKEASETGAARKDLEVDDRTRECWH